ncbi:MAG: ABC transporter ATP-binding protein [Phycisphaeraceae bacterium]|nr:ABC transporter ATP-binding protein [Phycisphaeraceae bacterium]
MIDVKNLVKWYGPTKAVDHLSFHIPTGQVVGFLGRNGAGKTTTIRILTGYLPPTSGIATINGHDVTTQSAKARAAIGYLPESTPLYHEMRVEEYLDYRGQLQAMDRKRRRTRIDQVVARCGLSAVRRRVIGQLSKGNKQRVGLAQAMLHDPPVLILDEPTSGLDPTQIYEFRKLLDELRGKHTIILSTHNLGEITRVADRAVIIDQGIIRYDAPISRQMRLMIEVKAAPEAVLRISESIKRITKVIVSMHEGWTKALIETENCQDLREDVGQFALSNQWTIRQLGFETTDIERKFAEVTGGKAVAPSQD